MNEATLCEESGQSHGLQSNQHGQSGEIRQATEHGQATAEYALLTGVVALIIALVAAWAAGTGKVGQLLDVVFDGLIRAAG